MFFFSLQINDDSSNFFRESLGSLNSRFFPPVFYFYLDNSLLFQGSFYGVHHDCQTDMR